MTVEETTDTDHGHDSAGAHRGITGPPRTFNRNALVRTTDITTDTTDTRDHGHDCGVYRPPVGPVRRSYGPLASARGPGRLVTDCARALGVVLAPLCAHPFSDSAEPPARDECGHGLARACGRDDMALTSGSDASSGLRLRHGHLSNGLDPR